MSGKKGTGTVIMAGIVGGTGYTGVESQARGVKIIDLAADFRRQDTAVHEGWRGMLPSCPDLFREAVDGLPETTGLMQVPVLP